MRFRAGKGAATGPLLLALLLLLSVKPADAVTTYTCGGFAPTTTACTTGSRVYVSTISHDVAADINYAGTLESELIWSAGRRTFRCTYTQGLARQCIASGQFPPLNASFTHQCRSLVPGSAVQPGSGIVLGGVGGGVGTWSCEVVV